MQPNSKTKPGTLLRATKDWGARRGARSWFQAGDIVYFHFMGDLYRKSEEGPYVYISSPFIKTPREIGGFYPDMFEVIESNEGE